MPSFDTPEVTIVEVKKPWQMWQLSIVRGDNLVPTEVHTRFLPLTSDGILWKDLPGGPKIANVIDKKLEIENPTQDQLDDSTAAEMLRDLILGAILPAAAPTRLSPDEQNSYNLALAQFKRMGARTSLPASEGLVIREAGEVCMGMFKVLNLLTNESNI